MRAFRTIRDEMREAVTLATHPALAAHSDAPMIRQQEPPERDAWPVIEPWMQKAFDELVQASRTGQPFLLLPCTVNGEATAAIVHVSHTDERNRFHVTPLFVGMTPGMALIDAAGRKVGGQAQ